MKCLNLRVLINLSLFQRLGYNLYISLIYINRCISVFLLSGKLFILLFALVICWSIYCFSAKCIFPNYFLNVSIAYPISPFIYHNFNTLWLCCELYILCGLDHEIIIIWLIYRHIIHHFDYKNRRIGKQFDKHYMWNSYDDMFNYWRIEVKINY